MQCSIECIYFGETAELQIELWGAPVVAEPRRTESRSVHADGCDKRCVSLKLAR